MIEENSIEQWLIKKYKKEIVNEVRGELRGATISVAENFKSSIIRFNLKFGSWIDDCKDVEYLKGLDPNNKEKYTSEKSKLPRFFLTTGGAPGTYIADMNEIKNCFCIIDVDHIECTEELFKKLNSVPFVVGTAKSLSGKGYYSVMKFAADKVKDFQSFSLFYEEVIDWYRDELGVELDASLKTPKKSRTLSPYEFVWNDDYQGEFVPEFYHKKDIETESIDLEKYDIVEGGDVSKLVVKYEENRMYYKRYSWANTLYNVFGENGKEIFDAILVEDPDKDNKEACWRSASSGKQRSSDFCLSMLKRAGFLVENLKREYERICIEGGGRKMLSW